MVDGDLSLGSFEVDAFSGEVVGAAAGYMDSGKCWDCLELGAFL